jgi:PTS system mannose-specific IIA component
MSDAPFKIGCVIVAHGNVAKCLMEAVEGILGKQSHWTAISNRGMGLAELRRTVTNAIDEMCEDCRVVMMSDMPGGSCHHVCSEIARQREDVRSLTGLNLMMLLEFFVKRERHDVNELVGLVMERGRDAVRLL